MYSAKTTNTTLALAISTVLATASSQAAPVAPNDTHSTVFNHSFFQLADNQAAQEALPPANVEQQQWNAYERSEYTYADAKNLAEYWGEPTALDAKYKMGSLLLGGKDAEIQQALLELRQWQIYSNSQYTYEDAELLAEYWGKSEPWYAKLKIGSLLNDGNDTAIQQALQQAANQPANTKPESANAEQQEKQQWQAYSNSHYTYEDAELLATYWGKPEPWNAKLKIGSLLIGGNDAAIQQALQQATANQPTNTKPESANAEQQEQKQWQAYSNSHYTYEDAELLATYWGKPEPWNAKLKIGSLLIGGNDAAIQQALQHAIAGNANTPANTEQQQ